MDPEPSRPDCELDQDSRIWITLGAAERLLGCAVAAFPKKPSCRSATRLSDVTHQSA